MITIKNVKNFEGKIMDHQVQSSHEQTIDGEGKLTLFPALTDPHIHLLRSLSSWKALTLSALKGGITTLFTVPTAILSASNLTSLKQKLESISHQLEENHLPLSCWFYLGADPSYFEQVGRVKKLIAGVFLSRKVQDDHSSLEEAMINRIFELAAMEDMIVAIDAKEESVVKTSKHTERFSTFLETALHYTERFGARLYVLNVGTAKELEIIRYYQDKGVLVYIETPFDYLLADQGDKKLLSSSYISQREMNVQAIWEALRHGRIDAIGSGVLEDSSEQFLKLTYFLPVLLTAYHQKKLSLESIVNLTQLNIERILELKGLQDIILVDLEKEKTVPLEEASSWHLSSSTSSLTLKGWPLYAIVKGQVFNLSDL